jgi:hypothetical protein
VLTVTVPHLERFSIDNILHFHEKELLLTILNSDHFPSLKTCQFSGKFYHVSEFSDHRQLPNNTIRTVILNRWEGSQLGPLLDLLPNLRRFETNFLEPINELTNFNKPHMSLSYLRVTLKDPLNDLSQILPHTTNLKQLRVTGKINEDSVLEYFEKLAKILRSHIPCLQQFDCELYLHAWNDQVDTITIQQLHSLFRMIQCYLGRDINQCYTTDLTEYPYSSEYACEYRLSLSIDFLISYVMIID